MYGDMSRETSYQRQLAPFRMTPLGSAILWAQNVHEFLYHRGSVYVESHEGFLPEFARPYARIKLTTDQRYEDANESLESL